MKLDRVFEKLKPTLLEADEATKDGLPEANELVKASNDKLAPLLDLRSECFYRLDEYSAASEDCLQLLQMQPECVTVAERYIKCLLGLKQYDMAETSLTQFEKSIEELAPGSTATFVPQLRQLIKTINLERIGVYDMDALTKEVISLSSADGDIRAQRMVRMGPHGEYLHPLVECVATPGKGYGMRVREAADSIDQAAPRNSLVPSGAVAMTGFIPKGTLIMASKAIMAHLKSDGLTECEMLTRKCMDHPQLAEQVFRLASGRDDEELRGALMEAQDVVALFEQSIPIVTPDESARRVFDLRDQLTKAIHTKLFGRGDDTGMWFLPSLLNHSCLPNVKWVFRGDLIFLTTTQDVAPGGEITISYISSLMLPYHERQFRFMRGWNSSARARAARCISNIHTSSRSRIV